MDKKVHCQNEVWSKPRWQEEALKTILADCDDEIPILNVENSQKK